MNEKRKTIIISILTLMLLSMGGIGLYYWYENTYYISTEDAKVTGDLVKVSPQISGKLLELNVNEGQTVEKDQILGRQDKSNLPAISIESSIMRAPISGLVIKKQGTVGEIVLPGQTLVMLVDQKKLYISANIEETKLENIKIGQSVDVTIDEFKGETFQGKVSFIGQASNSTFSLLPSSTGGNFTKVIQKVPVKIELNNTDKKLLPGTNAVVKIHIK